MIDVTAGRSNSRILLPHFTSKIFNEFRYKSSHSMCKIKKGTGIEEERQRGKRDKQTDRQREKDVKIKG